jgi:signal transduction histidine kinase
LENLLTNAIKFSPSGTDVVLTARLEGGSVRFDVTDEGPGIAVEQQGRLFLRFEREEQGEVSRAGLGLGLSIVRRVAEAHGGGVGVASRPGQGATFWISFPINSPLRDEAAPTTVR